MEKECSGWMVAEWRNVEVNDARGQWAVGWRCCTWNMKEPAASTRAWWGEGGNGRMER